MVIEWPTVSPSLSHTQIEYATNRFPGTKRRIIITLHLLIRGIIFLTFFVFGFDISWKNPSYSNGEKMMMKKSKLCSAVQAPSNVTGRMYRIIRGNIPAVFFPPLHFVSIYPPIVTHVFHWFLFQREKNITKLTEISLVTPLDPKSWRQYHQRYID